MQPSHVHSDIAKAKFGCILLFLAAVGLFLFLLGLPYLMDDSGETQGQEEAIESAN